MSLLACSELRSASTLAKKSYFVVAIKSLYWQAINSICSEVHASRRLSTPREVEDRQYDRVRERKREEERLEAVASTDAFRVDLAVTDALYGVLHFPDKR